MSVSIRPGVPSDASYLTELALRSKGHWGYSAEFLEACRSELTVSPSSCSAGDVSVALVDGVVAGFSLVQGDSLESLFVDPPFIGRGVGGVLLSQALELAVARGITRLVLDADPFAEPFYVRYGARRVGEVPSGTVAGRLLPQLVFDLAPASA